MTKKALLKECAKIMQTPKVEKWYERNLHKEKQENTINQLQYAIETKELTPKEALSICLVVGFQWNEDFEKEQKEVIEQDEQEK